MADLNLTATDDGEQNWSNRTIFVGDNLDVMRGMNSASVDLLYLDPPFNSNRDYFAPIGSQAAGAMFEDVWKWSDVDLANLGELREKLPRLSAVVDVARSTHSDAMASYLVFMGVRVIEMKRLLKPAASIYLHCDPTASHYLKLMMDAIFGRQQFENEIIWSYRRWPSKQARFQRMHDVILFYSRDGSNDGRTFNVALEPLAESSQKRFRGRRPHQAAGATKKDWLENGSEGTPQRDVFDLSIIAPASKERTGYPTQKPLALMKRIVKASSNPGDVIFDPFCGCATTCVAAENAGRQWIGIDLSAKAGELVMDRLCSGKQAVIRRTDISIREDVPKRTDLGSIPPYNSRENKERLYGRQEGFCNLCKEHFQMRNLEIDHIVASTRGGHDHIDNLQLLCGSCNRIKGTRSMAEAIAIAEERGLRRQ